MNKYYKISPEWAKKINVTDRAPMHPDGWYLVLPTFALPLKNILPPEEYGEINTLDDAVSAIGGCIYTEAEALASYRGDKDYMMNSREGSAEETAPETTEHENNGSAGPSGSDTEIKEEETDIPSDADALETSTKN